jgi:hypothetical protein
MGAKMPTKRYYLSYPIMNGSARGAHEISKLAEIRNRSIVEKAVASLPIK